MTIMKLHPKHETEPKRAYRVEAKFIFNYGNMWNITYQAVAASPEDISVQIAETMELGGIIKLPGENGQTWLIDFGLVVAVHIVSVT